MSYETILTDNVGSVRVITMHRPERLNAWTYQMGGELRAAIEAGNTDDDVDAMVLTGAGRGFCAGADVEAVFKAQSEGEDVSRGGGAGNWVELMRLSKPIVAAVNGAAIGLGVTQILPMDYILASDQAKLSVRFVKMGLVPELASSNFLRARVGFGQASELMLTGKTVNADEALQMGLVDKVTAPDDLLNEACHVAAAMGSNPRSAVQHIKQLITANANETDLALVQQRELEALNQCYASAEHKEAIGAFLEKREPDFKTARQQD
ncbi:MAG: enoyl-CoA hydratase-related protein [Pseudomonadota bacterium]